MSICTSNRGTTPAFEILVGSPASLIKPTGQNVGLDPSVPLVRQEHLEPLREPVEILGGKLGNGGLKFFNAHAVQTNTECLTTARGLRAFSSRLEELV